MTYIASATVRRADSADVMPAVAYGVTAAAAERS
jgi:hypothetical protein